MKSINNLKKKFVIALLIVIILSIVFLIYNKTARQKDYIYGMIRVIEQDCDGRKVTEDEYDKLNPPKDMFYPFATVLTKKEYYDDGECAIYMNYKKSQIDIYNKVKHDEVSKLFYYVESYFPDDSSNVRGSFAVEVREYSEDSIAKDKYSIESKKIHDYFKTTQKDDYIYESKYNEKFYRGIDEDNHYLVMCEYQKEANYLTGNIISINGLCVINIRFSFDDCDEYYNDLCHILDYMNISHPKSVEME